MNLRWTLSVSLAFALIMVSAVHARADLSPKQARSLITKAAGMSLPSGAVRVGRVEMAGADAAEAAAEVDLVFRLARPESGWRISELRIGPDRWERFSIIAAALGVEVPASRCDARDEFQKTNAELSVKRVRCLVAELLGVDLPSDDVRIKSFSSFAVPLASEESVIVVTKVRLSVRFARRGKGWQVTELKSGNRTWTNIENLPAAVATVKTARATEDMKVLAAALNEFRRERGTFVVTDKHPALVDHLSPRYLSRVIRLDPWHNPYQYQGERTSFTLRSAGPDGKLNTADDVILNREMP